jgi:hypothetical protein
MGDFQITCINRPGGRTDPHSRIEYLGQEGNWKISEANMIRRIRNRSDTFYTLVVGRRADIIVAERNGVPYLKTAEDATRRDNLLALDECKNCKIIE